MGLWKHEGELFMGLSREQQVDVAVSFTAFRAMRSNKAYLTMPITGGERLYNTLDRYQVRSIEELEAKKPGALRSEVIEPNLAAAEEFARVVGMRASYPLVVPGDFEARGQRWTQDQYMVLWLRLISTQVRELHLCEGWQYSNGGAMEFGRAVLIMFNCIEGRTPEMTIRNHRGAEVSLAEEIRRLADAVLNLEQRGHAAPKLRIELNNILGLGALLNDPLTSRSEWLHLTKGNDHGLTPSFIRSVVGLIGGPVAFWGTVPDLPLAS